tara:strand:+ start:1803 stop:2027 length:225 start_codon:yes stop_codon:yes gene_type:complete
MATRQQLKDDLKKQLKEMSTSGAAGAYSTPYAFNPNKNAQGTSRNYYLKMGWKLVNKNKVRKAAKGMEYKDLWK